MAGRPGLEPEITVLETAVIAISPSPYVLVEIMGTAPMSELTI